MIISCGEAWLWVIESDVEMKQQEDYNISGIFKLITVVYLVLAFGAYFLTFVFSRLARIKDLLGL